MAQVSTATRLQSLNVDATKVQLADLNVAANQHLVLDTSDKTYAKSVTELAPQSIDDVKKWLGTPDTAFTKAPVAKKTATVPEAVIPVSKQYSDAQVATLYALANDYVYGSSTQVSAEQIPALNAWLKALAPKIPMFTFNNITVAAGATLEVKASALFANYITVEKTGQIKLKGGSKTVIHAAGFTGK